MEITSEEIIKINKDGCIFLEKEALENILNSDELKDMPISVISVTGEFRTGKSFLLNFFIRYLRAVCLQEFDVEDWLNPNFGTLEGFSFAPGARRHTTGIHIWPEIYCIELPSAEKVAVLLLDTQGSFDNQSTIDDCAKIFALSTLISSVQIFNLFGNIKQYNLNHLHLFSGYGSLLSNPGAAPYQNLIFLVRDWRWPEDNNYGADGGNLLLNEVFSEAHAELTTTIADIKTSFDKISCFLMPHPGKTVETPAFNKTTNEIHENFLTYVQDFVLNILAPENLVLKTIDGKVVKAGELVTYLEGYCDTLRKDGLPKPQTLFQATAEAQHKLAYEDALQLYKKQMDYDTKESLKCYFIHELYNLHSLKKVAAVKKFLTNKKLHDPQICATYLLKIKKVVDEEFYIYNKINEEKVAKYEEQEKMRQEKEQMGDQSDEQPSGSGGFWRRVFFR